VLDFFRKRPDKVPVFEHILVDEYQDINSLQFELLDMLRPKNLFAVGDPRQSIYGWRGSKIEYILDFEKNYEGAKVLQLSANYRSSKNIVSLCNKIISSIKLPDLTSVSENGDEVKFIRHESEDAENLFVAQSILGSDVQRDEIFVLARTNKQLDSIAQVMDRYGIKYLKRTIENTKQSKVPEKDEVTLSTIHAIKGLEAERVYVIGANAKNHPCKASEHPILEAVKAQDTYDKLGEELRLLYVALSRAKKQLIINYSGSISSYFSEKAKEPLKESKQVKYKSNHPSGLYDELKNFRSDESRRLGIPPYQVFNDRTLDEICEVQPVSFEELMDINGLGQFKIRKWGSKILSIVRNTAV
jgi:superfamily I DNA/RNA helicase